MKKTFRLIAMALMAGAMFTACGGDDEAKTPGGGTDGPGGEEGYPENVVIPKKPSGSVKAGIVGAIEVLGEGFDPDWDVIRIGYKDEFGNDEFELLTNDVEVVIKGSRITAGIPIGSATLGKKATLYLDRPGYTKMPITEELTVAVPEVSDGYIPDPAFRATLKNNNNRVVFNPLGLLDVDAAKSMKSGSDNGDMVYGLNLYGCQATSLEGIELFESVEGLVVGWDASLSNIKKIDFSKWQAKGIDIRIQKAPLLEEIIGSPYCHQILASGCPKLKKVDVHLCRGLRNLDISGASSDNKDFSANATQGTVMFLDMRKEQGGWYRDNDNGGFIDANPPKFVMNENQHTTYASMGLKLADGAEVWVDSWWIADHGGWTDIYNGWKDHGVTVKVFARYEPQFSENMLLGTIPTYQQAPDALSPSSVSLGNVPPANKWKFDDPSSRLDYPGNESSWGNDESGAVYGGIPWNPIPGPGIDPVGSL